MADGAFDRKIRCEFRVDRPQDAEAVLDACGWRWTEVSPQTYQVDVEVRGGPRGASTRARELLLDELRRHGLKVRLRWVRTLKAPAQSGDRVEVHEVRAARWPRLERFLVACGARDVGASIQATDEQDADRQLLLLMSANDERRDLGWRTRFGQPRLPAAPGDERPEPVAWIIAVMLGSAAAGYVLGFLGPTAPSIGLGAVLLPILAVTLAYLQRRPEWAVLPPGIAAMTMMAGAEVRESDDEWYHLPVVSVLVLLGYGVRHLLRDLSAAQRASWLVPMLLPLIVPVTAYIGDLAYGVYLDALGLSRESVTLGLWDRLAAAAVPIGVAAVVSLCTLGLFGWLTYVHFQVPMIFALPVVLAYLVSGIAIAFDKGAAAGEIPEKGFVALRPEWVCATPVEDKVATRGAALPAPPRPLLHLELANGQIALWDAALGWRKGLIKAPVDKLRLVRVDGRGARCQ